MRTASGCHRACGETDYQEQQSSVPFSPTSRALKSQTSGRCQRWHWDMQVCLTTVTFHSHIKTGSFFPLFTLVFSSLSPPCSLHLPPSSCYGRNSQIPQPRVRKCNVHPADSPEPALTLHLPLGNSSQPHTFPPPDLYWY